MVINLEGAFTNRACVCKVPHTLFKNPISITLRNSNAWQCILKGIGIEVLDGVVVFQVGCSITPWNQTIRAITLRSVFLLRNRFFQMMGLGDSYLN